MLDVGIKNQLDYKKKSPKAVNVAAFVTNRVANQLKIRSTSKVTRC